MTRYRITIRGDDAELRGYMDGNRASLTKLSMMTKPFGLVVVASEAEDDYNPFKEEKPDAPH